jgi:hypothetical protein
MTASTINRLIALFDGAFRALAPGLGMADAERMATLVHRSMSPRTRSYHTSDHVFDMCEGANARQTLAGLFHDLVYYQLDGGFPSGVAHRLNAVVRDEQGEISIRPFEVDDEVMFLCTSIFGFEVGKPLSVYAGLNEFMSALVAGHQLHKHLQRTDLIGVMACIEATIPFRNTVQNGESAPDLLARRVRAVTQTCLPELTGAALDAHVASVMRDAVEIGNRDVRGFALPNHALFLSNTWLLIEESNAPLKAVGVYAISEYRSALVRMAGFLGHLDPASIFQSHCGYPDDDTLEAWTAAARGNLRFACDYLDCKTVSVAIIEALAVETGTDAPVSMLLGDIASLHGKPERAEDYLPEVSPEAAQNDALLKVLDKGRAQESRNDLTSSPLTAFTYRCIGQEGMRAAIAQAHRMFAGTITPLEFLHTLDHEMVRAIMRACARIAVSRRDALLALEESF